MKRIGCALLAVAGGMVLAWLIRNALPWDAEPLLPIAEPEYLDEVLGW